MKERPILFSAKMVRAIIAGRKTQTRRVVKSAPDAAFLGCVESEQLDCFDAVFDSETDAVRHSPYGRPGDRLWVRESWKTARSLDAVKPSKIGRGAPVVFAADQWNDGYPRGFDGGKLRPSIFMPRWVSRILLEVVEIRVERLQEISESSVWAEGLKASDVYPFTVNNLKSQLTREQIDNLNPKSAACRAFASLWDSINGTPRGDGSDISWSSNPWVWTVVFKRVEA